MAPASPLRKADSNPAEQMELILAELRIRERFLVVSHARPDGDAVGSALTMAAILEQMGKSVNIVLSDAVPWVYRTLPGVEHIQRKRRIDAADYDAAIILECDGTARTGVEGMDGLFLINIDHHRTGCPYGAINWIDPDASAVAAMVYELALAARVVVNASMATCLYTALMTDTGSFTYPGTSAETFTLAHTLIALGAKADTVARDVLYSVPAARIHLLGVALSRIRIEGPLAWTYIMQKDLDDLTASDEDSEGTVNYLISIVNVEAAAFLREMPGKPQHFRTSLRSKSSVDVSHAATLCGGGGHRNAAGCTLDGPLDAAVALILERLRHEVELTALLVRPSQDDTLPVSSPFQL
jgi:phosphoesterase RecJ-like protein